MTTWKLKEDSMASQNQKTPNSDADRELTDAEVKREQQGNPPAEREHIAYEALGEEGGEAVKDTYIDPWRKDSPQNQNNQGNRGDQGTKSR